MAQLLDRPHDLAPVPDGTLPRVIVSVLATVVLSALAIGYLTIGGTDADGLGATAVVAGLSAFTSFVGAVVILSATRRLKPALWGYVPGFTGVLAGGLALGEAVRLDNGDGTWVLGFLALLNPLLWVPFYTGIALLVRHGQRVSGETSTSTPSPAKQRILAAGRASNSSSR